MPLQALSELYGPRGHKDSCTINVIFINKFKKYEINLLYNL